MLEIFFCEITDIIIGVIIVMEIIIAMITTIVHGDMIKTNDHLSERCLKLPSVGGNCRPFKGAFSFPGSGFLGRKLENVSIAG